jgi:Bacteriocin-protection, YdeI or OmpD-Associated/Domain of unknown function (DUF1905)
VARAKFIAKLVRPPAVGAWTFAEVPADWVKRTGLRSHSRVAGTIEGVAFRSSLMPRGDGVFFVVVASGIRERIGREPGDTVRIELDVDRAPVRILVPKELQAALTRDGAAKKRFDALAPSHRKAYAQWVGSAVQAETRARRVEKALAMIRNGETLN